MYATARTLYSHHLVKMQPKSVGAYLTTAHRHTELNIRAVGTNFDIRSIHSAAELGTPDPAPAPTPDPAEPPSQLIGRANNGAIGSRTGFRTVVSISLPIL